jgi:hypothetical protein
MGALGEVPLLAGPRPAILALADGGRRRVFAMNQRKKEQTILRKGDLGGRLLLRDVPRYFRARLGHNSTAGRGRHGEAVRERDPGLHRRADIGQLQWGIPPIWETHKYGRLSL